MIQTKTFTVKQAGSGQREFEQHELIWLWRTAQLPHDAQFQDDAGEWRPIDELLRTA